jgi:hypothetical protein
MKALRIATTVRGETPRLAARRAMTRSFMIKGTRQPAARRMEKATRRRRIGIEAMQRERSKRTRPRSQRRASTETCSRCFR